MLKSIDAIKGLVLVNIVFFAVTFWFPGMEDRMFDWLALYFPKNENFAVWQFVTHIFMHGSLTHIIFNMYALWAFGTPLERIWGQNKFLLFYFLCGIGAGVIYLLVNYIQFDAIYNDLILSGLSSNDIQNIIANKSADQNTINAVSEEKLKDFLSLFYIPAVGASGAVYGVLVAFGILYPNAKLALLFLPVPIAAKYFIPALIALDLFSGLTGFSIFGGGIAHFAHIGGAIIGFLLMLYWKKRGYKRGYID